LRRALAPPLGRSFALFWRALFRPTLFWWAFFRPALFWWAFFRPALFWWAFFRPALFWYRRGRTGRRVPREHRAP
jgi:hypothetical protein